MKIIIIIQLFSIFMSACNSNKQQNSVKKITEVIQTDEYSILSIEDELILKDSILVHAKIDTPFNKGCTSNNNDSNIINMDSILSIEDCDGTREELLSQYFAKVDNYRNYYSDVDLKVIFREDTIVIANDSIANELKYKIYNVDAKNPCIMKLPHGPPPLKNENFPKEGFIIDKSLKTNNQPYKKEFFEVWTFYLNEVNKFSGGDFAGFDVPRATKTSRIDLEASISGVKPRFYEEKSFFRQICQYRLPDFGKYKIYYDLIGGGGPLQLEKSPFIRKEGTYNEIGSEHGIYGFLIMYDTTNSHAHIINILSFNNPTSIVDDLHFRFFFITKDKEILIYEGMSKRQKNLQTNKYTDKYKITIQKTHSITVDSNNKIVIENLIKNDPNY